MAIELEGEYTTARVLVDDESLVEDDCLAQIQTLIDHPAFTEPVRIMPDTHPGAGAPIGFTMPLADRVVPNIVGVDVGCGMAATNLGAELPLEGPEREQRVREAVPMGQQVHDYDDAPHLVDEFPFARANRVFERFAAAYEERFGQPIDPVETVSPDRPSNERVDWLVSGCNAGSNDCISTAGAQYTEQMSHECDACGETFTTLSRLRLHDCPAEESESTDPLSSFDSFLDSISEELEADIQRNAQEREKRGLAAASETLKTTLEEAARGDPDAAVRFIAGYERELREHHDAEDYDTYRGILWAFYEPAGEMLDEIATREGWDFLGDLVDAYPREGPDEEPFASPVIENAVGRYVIRTRLRDGVEAIPVPALSYLGSFWESAGDVSWEESFTYGWGIGHPEHSVADQVRETVTEELFWVRGVLPHTFYADQHAAADLLEALLTDERVDYEDRYTLASILATVDHDSTPKIPRYWDFREELDYRFQWDEAVRTRLRDVIETEGFHARLPENWTFSDMEL